MLKVLGWILISLGVLYTIFQIYLIFNLEGWEDIISSWFAFGLIPIVLGWALIFYIPKKYYIHTKNKFK